jgi:hypothetical protein
MIERRGADVVLAEIEKILAGYRRHVAENGPSPQLRDEAIAAIRKLGHSAADARRWVDAKPARR